MLYQRIKSCLEYKVMYDMQISLIYINVSNIKYWSFDNDMDISFICNGDNIYDFPEMMNTFV